MWGKCEKLSSTAGRAILAKPAQHADAPHPPGLLRPRRERPCNRAAEQRDELAAFPVEHGASRALGDRKGCAPNCPCGRPEPFGIVPERPSLHEVTISHLQGVDFWASAVRVCLAKQQTVGEGGRRIEGDQRRRCRASEDEMSVTPKLSARMTDRRRRADPHRGGHAPPLPIIVPRAQRKTPPLGEGCGGVPAP